ncbi:hypothetical protein ACS0TY_032720 [Phlomoides rotata]
MELNLWMILVILVPILVSHSASCQYIETSCSDNNVTYEINSTFDNNLKSLLQSLSTETPQNNGFYVTSAGNGSDQIKGRALCRGDTPQAVCKSCIETASRDIRNRCQKEAAVIWVEKCQLEYSYGVLPTNYAGHYPDSNSKQASDSVQFCNALNSLRATLSEITATSKLKFASGKHRISDEETLYGLVQCTRDIDPGKCTYCLDQAFGELNGCTSSKGGVVLSRTCNMRFELYRFYDEPHRKGKIRASVAIAISATMFVVAIGGLYAVYRKKTTKARDEENSQSPVLEDNDTLITPVVIKEETGMLTSQDLPLMEFSIIKAATDNFSDSHKLGQGGFGSVYKGVLPNGDEIAVKRLSRRSWQGSIEFMNEIRIIAKLQHRNLVRLLSCSLEGNEKLLIYEYVPNKSLDIFLFDSEKRILLDWKKRINIINGIARGLVYLHQESRLKIVHRDLKPSNVLLDVEMSAKISDFGLARIFSDDQNLANTKRVVGTYGYMAPEYAMEGVFSVKSDVFSFGVILLEIISGKRNSGFHLTHHAHHTLLAYAWEVWNEGRELDLLDPILTESCPMQELGKYIEIGLVCVQEDPAERPTMSQVVVSLESKLAELPRPNKPAFSVGRVVRHTEDSSSATKHSINQVTVSSIAPR